MDNNYQWDPKTLDQILREKEEKEQKDAGGCYEPRREVEHPFHGNVGIVDR